MSNNNNDPSIQNIRKPTKMAYSYFEEKGISKQTVDKYKLTTKKNQNNVLEIPLIDNKGTIVLTKTKVLLKEELGELDEKKSILFGMYQCDTDADILIIAKNEEDCLSVVESGFNNVVSVPIGTAIFDWYENCKDWLSQFKKLLVLGDYKDGFKTLIDNLNSKYKGEIFNIKPTLFRDCKDINEIFTNYGKDGIKSIVENKTPSFPHDCFLKLSDIKIKQYNEKDFLKTQLQVLDKELGGGILKGSVFLLGGDTGCGKSTFASQIVANAIDQGIKTFIYSGEGKLEDYAKSLTFQWASKDNIIIDKKGDYLKNHVSEPIIEKIENWGDKYLTTFDSDTNDAKENPDKTIDIIEKAIYQCECELVLVDNLMTAMQGNYGNDLNAEQSKFIGSLRRLASYENIVIILIAHNNKYTVKGNKNAISGSKDIVNMASIYVSYDMPEENELTKEQEKYGHGNIRVLNIVKNRNGGKCKDDIILAYEPESKRIEETSIYKYDFHSIKKGKDKDLKDMFKRKYNWETQEQLTIDKLKSEV